MDNIIINKKISIYKNNYIPDKTILKYIGFNKYCKLYKSDPTLYEYFSECKDLIDQYDQIDLDLIDINLTSLEIKKQIISLIFKDTNYTKNEYINNLVYKNPKNIYTKDNNYDIFIFFIIILIFLISIFYILYKLGFINYVFYKHCDTDSCRLYYSL